MEQDIQPSISSENISPPSHQMSKTKSGFLIFFGIITPAIAAMLLFFLSTGSAIIHMEWHGYFFAIIPIGNFVLWYAIRHNKISWLSWLGFLGGVTLCISGIYAIIFLPIAYIGIISILMIYGIIAFGIGFVLISPISAFVSALFFYNYIKNIAIAEGKKFSVWQGVVVVLCIFGLSQIHSQITIRGMNMAASADSGEHIRGVKLLRTLGSESEMLKRCYGMNRRNHIMFIWHDVFQKDFLGLWDMPSPEKSREIYYRVTGKPFNSVPPPKYSSHSGGWNFWWDSNLGGDKVAQKVEGLWLNASRLDGKIEPDAATSYLEWTMVFKNDSRIQQEARAQILLPKGGVVSRLTLWVNGEEREAAFTTRGKAREAYNKVVSQKRDPVLVSYDGADRILMQCFPVPPSGEMKIRIGMTCPLTLDSKDEGTLTLPRILENNFNIAEGFGHSVWIDSKTPLSSSEKSLISTEADKFILKGNISEQSFSDAAVVMRVRRSAEILSAWTSDPTDNDSAIYQIIQETTALSPKQVIFVIDGSAGMKAHIPAIADILSQVPEGLQYGVILGSDKTETLSASASHKDMQAIALQLKNADYEGGCDNVSALEQAWDIANSKLNPIIIWVHATQPVLLKSAEGLKQRWQRSRGIRWTDVQIAPGPNRIVENLEKTDKPEILSISKNPGDDINRFISTWKQKRSDFSRKKIQKQEIESLKPDVQASSHIALLWANTEIAKHYKDGNTDEAVNLASRYRLVTPVSSAVVLENKQQYKDAGIEVPEYKPGKDYEFNDNIGSKDAMGGGVPEPATLWLMVIGIILIAIWKIRCSKAAQL
jgi:hypothetical protein